MGTLRCCESLWWECLSLVNAGQVCREKAVLRAKRDLLGLVLVLSLSSYTTKSGRGALRPRSKKAPNDMHANKKKNSKMDSPFPSQTAAGLPLMRSSTFLWVCGAFRQ